MKAFYLVVREFLLVNESKGYYQKVNESHQWCIKYHYHMQKSGLLPDCSLHLHLLFDTMCAEASFDGMGFSSDISSKGDDFIKQWHCPWVYTVVDEIAPVFKSILKENYLSSASPKEDTKDNRLLWWSQRKRLDDCFGKFLQ